MQALALQLVEISVARCLQSSLSPVPTPTRRSAPLICTPLLASPLPPLNAHMHACACAVNRPRLRERLASAATP